MALVRPEVSPNAMTRPFPNGCSAASTMSPSFSPESYRSLPIMPRSLASSPSSVQPHRPIRSGRAGQWAMTDAPMTTPNWFWSSAMPAVAGWLRASYDCSQPPTANVAESNRTRMAVGARISLNRLLPLGSRVVCSPSTSSEPPRRTKLWMRSTWPSRHGSSGKMSTRTSASFTSASERSGEMRHLAPRLSSKTGSIPYMPLDSLPYESCVGLSQLRNPFS